jgi:hypothetical protein
VHDGLGGGLGRLIIQKYDVCHPGGESFDAEGCKAWRESASGKCISELLGGETDFTQSNIPYYMGNPCRELERQKNARPRYVPPLGGDKKMNRLLLTVGLGAAAYFLFGRK